MLPCLSWVWTRNPTNWKCRLFPMLAALLTVLRHLLRLILPFNMNMRDHIESNYGEYLLNVLYCVKLGCWQRVRDCWRSDDNSSCNHWWLFSDFFIHEFDLLGWQFFFLMIYKLVWVFQLPRRLLMGLQVKIGEVAVVLDKISSPVPLVQRR